MNEIETPQSVPQTVPRPRGWIALRVIGGIARWTWRLITIAFGLFALVFLAAGLGQGGHIISTDPRDLVLIIGGLFLFGVLVMGWWREGLAGLIILVALLLFTVVDDIVQHQGLRQMLADVYEGPMVVPLLMLLSWALHTLNDQTAVPWKRRLALITAVLAAAAVACFIPKLRFPANA